MNKETSSIRLTPELEKKLRHLYEKYYPKTEMSPYLGCYDMSSIVSGEFDLPIAEGNFLRDTKQGPKADAAPHAWNEDAEGVIIDFTRHQFNRNLPPEDQIPTDMLPIIHPDEKGYDRYVPDYDTKKRREKNKINNS